MKDIFLEHSKKYPKMEINDYIKLIHQSVFGPAHFLANPSFETLLEYLKKEINELTDSTVHSIEEIGHGFYRVPLSMIKANKIPLELMAKCFLNSMNYKLDDRYILEKLMDRYIDDLLELIKDKGIDIDLDQSLEFVKHYKTTDYQPLHHSQTFRIHYHPHYRVIHKKFLIDSLL